MLNWVEIKVCDRFLRDNTSEDRLDPLTANIYTGARPGHKLAGRVRLIEQEVLSRAGVVVGVFSADNEDIPESWLPG